MGQQDSTDRVRLVAIAAAGGLVALAGIGALWLWAPGLDEGRSNRGMQDMMMRRKADAMEDLLDAMLHGRLGRVATAADRIDEYTTTIDAFLGTSMYRQHGEAFHTAIEDVQQAARAGDREAAKEATIRLERTCLECHHLLLDAPADAWTPRPR